MMSMMHVYRQECKVSDTLKFCMIALLILPFAWWVLLYSLRTKLHKQDSPRSKVTPLGVYRPVRSYGGKY
jgi:hypothetical protein